jgi:hypothetical protein
MQVSNAQHCEKPILRFAFPELSQLVLRYLLDVRARIIDFKHIYDPLHVDPPKGDHVCKGAVQR